MSSEQPVLVNSADSFHSRWGYYPCSYEDFRKIKTLRKHYEDTITQVYTLWRWLRREPQNRTGNRPEVSKIFSKTGEWYRHSKRHYKDGTEYDHYRILPMRVDDRGLLGLYELARRPSEKPVKFWSSQIELLNRLWYELVNENPTVGLDMKDDPDARPVEEFMTDEQRQDWEQRLKEIKG